MAEWPPFGKELLTWLTIFSFGNMSICNFGCFHFDIKDGTVVLIAPVPVHCLPITLQPDMALGR